jgi:D-alanine-D-alanine ligase
MKIGILTINSTELPEENLEDYEGRLDLSYLSRAKEALEVLGHKVEIVPVDHKSINFIDNLGFDIFLNFCFEGFKEIPDFEPHVVAALDVINVPYTGSNYLTIAMALDKILTKKLLMCHGVPTPKFQEFVTGEELFNSKLRFPLIVKPSKQDGSIGIRGDAVVRNEDQLRNKVKSIIKTYKQPALAEEYIDGREIVVAVMGNGDNIEVLPLTEFDYNGLPEGYEKICSYESKWKEGSVEFEKIPSVCPANVDSELYMDLIEYAITSYKIIGCRDYARVDFRIDTKGNPYVLEINPNCDPSYDAGLANMASKIGLNYGQLLEKIVKICAERTGVKEKKKKIIEKPITEKIVSVKKSGKRKVKVAA